MPKFLRFLDRIPDPNAPIPDRPLLVAEIRRVLPLLLYEARAQIRVLAALPAVDKGGLELYLQNAGVLTPEVFGLLLVMANGKPMLNNYVRQARHQALATYPCAAPDPSTCLGIVGLDGRPCAHEVGRTRYEAFRANCLAGFPAHYRQLLDNIDDVFEALRGK